MKSFFADLKKYRFLLLELIKKDIKLKYRSSVLGLLWTLIEPLLTMIVLTVVFGSLLGRGDESYPVYILSGRLLYTYFSNGTKTALKSVRKHGSMMNKVYMPKYMYPLASTLSGYVTFLISMIVLVGVMVYEKVPVTIHIFQAIVPLLIIVLLTSGFGLLLATLDVFFRDMEYLWTVAMMLVMYASAIFYKVDAVVNEGNAWVFRLNPLYALIVNFRNAVFGEAMDMYSLWYSLGFSVVIMIVGGVVFAWKQDKFVLYV